MHIAKGGTRKDIGIYVRSKMEANVARYYTFLKINWVYEPREFKFDKIKRGTKYYKPDFYLPAPIRLFIEVKGYFRPNDKTKLKRFKKYYPEEFDRLKFIIPDKYSGSKANGNMIKFLCDDLEIDFQEIIDYKTIEEYRGLIPGWE